MPVIFVFETILYYICIIIISNKILDGILQKQSILLSFSIYIPIVIMWKNMSQSLQCCVIYMILIFQIIFLCVTSKKIKFISLVYSIVFLFCFNAVLISLFIAVFSIPNKFQLIVEVAMHILMSVFCFVLCYTKISYKIKNIILWTPKIVKFIILILCILGMISMAFMININENLVGDSIASLALKTVATLIVFVLITFPIIILNATTNTYLKRLTHDYEEQIKVQAEHYSALAKANFELRRFRHDFKNISLGVKELIAEGKQTEALNILESAKENVYSTTDSMLRFDTGNGIVDALLSDKQRTSALSNIKIQFQGAVPPEGISATELCIIFGNTVDNAVEACEKIDAGTEKIIDIKCKCVSGFMFLNITNPVNEPVIIKNNTVQTTKSDKSLHGFGLYSLEKTVNSHDGKIELLCNNNEFSVNISMLINN